MPIQKHELFTVNYKESTNMKSKLILMLTGTKTVFFLQGLSITVYDLVCLDTFYVFHEPMTLVHQDW